VTRHEELFLEKDTIEELNEDIIKDVAPSSKSTLPTNKVWVQKAIITSNSPT
jgi:hypothetical protein